ncbi:MAG: hypothetical protein GF364_06420 [Candidatus Lokiarchaeota archaeon]|nr:hypothetical protein [Candidatus Lokiarchaeota archaeon]
MEELHRVLKQNGKLILFVEHRMDPIEAKKTFLKTGLFKLADDYVDMIGIISGLLIYSRT